MKKILQFLTLSIFGFSVTGYSQFNTQWTANYQHCTANNFSNESRKVVVDASGNSFVLADVTSNKDPNGIVTTQTFHYTVLNKYSIIGALISSKSIKVINHIVNGFDMNGAFGMEIDANNDIYIGYINYDPINNFDVVIAKYKNNMTLQWERVYNPSSLDAGVDMTVANGSVYAVVKSISGANTTYRIIKANANVTNDTALYSFTSNTDVVNAITVGGGILYTAGYRMMSGYKAALTVKVSTLGALKWERTYDGGMAGDDYAKDIGYGADGFLYIAGSSWRGSPNNFDMLLMKIAPNGTTAWNKFRDNNHLNDVGLIVQAKNLNYTYVGSTSGNNVVFDQVETFSGVAGGKAVYSPVPAAPYVSLSGIELNDFKVSANNGYYFCGSVFATDALGRLYGAEFLSKYVVASPLNRNSFIMETAMPVSGDFSNTKSGVSIFFDYSQNDIYWLTDIASDNGNHNQETVVLRDLNMISPIREGAPGGSQISGVISISPNPSKDVITLTSAEKMTKVELFEITGKWINNILPGSQKATMDISGLMNGIYIAKIYTEQGTVTSKKIVKD
jgi:hypothetical protein